MLYVGAKPIITVSQGVVERSFVAKGEKVVYQPEKLPDVDISGYMSPSIIAEASHNSTTKDWISRPEKSYYNNEEMWTNALKNYIIGEDLFFPVPYIGELIAENPYRSITDCNMKFTPSKSFQQIGAQFKLDNTTLALDKFTISLGGNTGYNFYGDSDIPGLSATANITKTTYPWAVLTIDSVDTNLPLVGTKIYLTRFAIK